MIQKCSTWKVLKIFLENPSDKHHIREISKKIILATTSVKNHLNYLMKKKLVIEKDDDVFKYYRANFDNPSFRFYKKINNQINIHESGILEFIEQEFNPDSIILFGSYAKGEDLENSDIDIFIQAKEKEVDLSKYEKKLSKKIQLFFAENLNKLPKELANNILNGTKLDGYTRVL